MTGFLNFYQHIPEHLNPSFSVCSFLISWYSLMYLVGFGVVYSLLSYRIKRGELNEKITNYKLQITNISPRLTRLGRELQDPNFKIKKNLQKEILLNFLLYSFIGLLIGARLGYVLFYDFNFYLKNPWAVVSPLDSAGNFVGIYGMSYHGGLLGIIAASFIFRKIYKINLWQWANFIAPAVPAGYFFGRVGNFLNGELYGRVTGKPWGMYFLSENGAPFLYLRHPSQLYEAFLEGIVLFAILWTLRDKKLLEGKLLGIYFIGYALARFAAEFFREPDVQIGFVFSFFTMGQILSLAMLAFGAALLLKIPKKWYT